MRPVPESVQAYIRKLLPGRIPLMNEMENEAERDGVPVMEPVSIEAMLQIMKLRNPSRILEIGSAIGYSAVRMADAMPDAHIYTIERDPGMYERAQFFIKQARVQELVTVFFGDALEMEEKVKDCGPFDIIFIDAAKAQYERFFKMYAPYLAENGLVMIDNVLFKGLVANQAADSKRLQKLARKIDSFNQWLAARPEYETVFYPIGDGLAVSRKK